MFMKRILEIGLAENGYVVECRVPIKPEKTDEELDLIRCGEKQYVAKDVPELVDLVEKITPMLDIEFSTEDEFNEAFDKAAM
jgi:hypothetical protein